MSEGLLIDFRPLGEESFVNGQSWQRCSSAWMHCYVARCPNWETAIWDLDGKKFVIWVL